MSSPADMLQHYRAKQRKYLRWRSEQEECHEQIPFFPPQLRQLRQEWFAKRYETYRARSHISRTDTSEEPRTMGDVLCNKEEPMSHKIWRWLRSSEDMDEEEHEDQNSMADER